MHDPYSLPNFNPLQAGAKGPRPHPTILQRGVEEFAQVRFPEPSALYRKRFGASQDDSRRCGLWRVPIWRRGM